MRISDWSSDVCSSDLLDGTDLASLHARLAGDGPDQVLGADPGDAPGAHEQAGHPVRAGAGPGRLATGGWAPAAGSAVVGRRLDLGDLVIVGGPAGGLVGQPHRGGGAVESGRAACWERVGPSG